MSSSVCSMSAKVQRVLMVIETKTETFVYNL